MEIEQWGHVHHPWLSPCLDFQHGIPSHDTFGRVFTVLESTKLQQVNLQGRVVTLDAMGCQVEIARQIVAQGGDYVLSLKENQPGLHWDCTELFAWLKGPHPLDQAVVLDYDAQGDGGYGRIETRKVWNTEVPVGLGSCERWAGLATFVMVESTRQGADQERTERRYYMSSLPDTTDHDAKRLNEVIHTHWEIENRVHWCWMSPWKRMPIARGTGKAHRISPSSESWR